MDMEAAAWHSLNGMAAAARGRRLWSGANARRAWAFILPHRRKLVLYTVLIVADGGLAVVAPLLAGHIIDAIATGSPPRVPALLALVIALTAIAEAAVGHATRHLAVSLGEGVTLDLRTAVFEHVLRMPVIFFIRTRTGALVSRLTGDVMDAQRAFTTILHGVLGNLIVLSLTLSVMLGISWRITGLALLMLPLFLLPARRTGAYLARHATEAADHGAALAGQMADRFSAPGAMLVKLFGSPHAEAATFATRARRVRDIRVRLTAVQSVFVTAVTLVSSLALALTYGMGGYLASGGGMDPGAVVALALLLSRLYGPLVALANARVEVMSALVSFERVFEVLDLKPLITDSAAARAVPEGPVSVEFEHVHFGHPPADLVSLASLEEVGNLGHHPTAQVLHDVSFRADPGQTIAVVGSSGAGKSTIAQLLCRLYDVDAGAVRLAGVDVRELTAESIRDTVGVVSQDGHVLHASIRDNLVLARQDVTEQEMWQALRRAALADVVEALPAGLDTVVGEGGCHLSGGERQRLAIARVLLARPRVVILDEATAHLDSVSEQAVQAALREALADRTVIVIAHRLSTVRDAHLIVVVDAGCVVESGTRTELLALNGRYAHLCAAQNSEESHLEC